jgi:hypothetical protein
MGDAVGGWSGRATKKEQLDGMRCTLELLWAELGLPLRALGCVGWCASCVFSAQMHACVWATCDSGSPICSMARRYERR